MKEINIIETRNDIKELLEYYLEEQYIIDYREIQGTDKKPVSSVRDGIVFNKFRSNHSETMETLTLGVTDDALRNEIAQVCKRELSVKDTFNNYTNYNIINEKNAFQDISELTIDEWIEKYYNSVVRNCIDKNYLSDSEFKTLLYLYYAFDNYRHLDKYNSEIFGLQKEFMGLQTNYGLNEFDRYNLIAVDNARSLLTVNPTRVYDNQLNRTFLLKNVPLSLCRIITNPDTVGINKLSVRLLDSIGLEGKFTEFTKDRKYEWLEKGCYFDFSVLDHSSETRLYSAEYHDCLWVAIDDNSITFEELYDSPDSIHNNAIVTQVLHCLYTKYNNEHYITHLDHEYIFYTKNEYSVRKHNHKQKGNAMPPMKNFKIDDSRIKLTRQFLYDVLACYFRHTERLQEYFKNT